MSDNSFVLKFTKMSVLTGRGNKTYRQFLTQALEEISSRHGICETSAISSLGSQDMWSLLENLFHSAECHCVLIKLYL